MACHSPASRNFAAEGTAEVLIAATSGDQGSLGLGGLSGNTGFFNGLLRSSTVVQ